MLGSIVLVVGIVVILAGLFSYRAWMNRALDVKRTVTVRIEQGMTGRDIGHLLREKNVIGSVTEFRWALWFKRAERDLRLGTVRIHPGITMEGLVETLRRKSPLMKRVQIPEGWPSWRIFNRLSHRLDLSQQGFRDLHDDPKFLENMNLPGSTLEGYLFPDTYNFSVDADHESVLRQMVRRFHAVARDVNLSDGADSVGMTVHEAVTLASIIQREATVETERPIVSAVFHNRLKRGMKLQADPTLLYELKDFDHPIFQSTIQRDSPYNTYRHVGLPPTPIANPGKESLKASVRPADVPYLYFVSRNDGKHVFSETLREHKRAVRQYQR